MSVSTAISKTATWLVRLVQLFWALILMGALSYMIHEFHKFDYDSPREVIVPQVASVLAIVVTVFSILAICFLGQTLQLVAAFLDFVIFVLYLTSAGLLRHNYHRHSDRNPLRNTLIGIRQANGESLRVDRTNGLVKLLVGGVVIQVVLFFITTLLGVFVARKGDERRRTSHAV